MLLSSSSCCFPDSDAVFRAGGTVSGDANVTQNARVCVRDVVSRNQKSVPSTSSFRTHSRRVLAKAQSQAPAQVS